MRSPDALDAWGAALSERASPIVVKEIRQGLRTRAFWVFFTLMLIACMVVALTAFSASPFSDTGKETYIALFVVLGMVQFFVIPFSAYRSMAREQEDETWVLLTLTGLGPRRVIRGKIASFVLQGFIYASAAVPFLLFSYYLNGIALPTILISLVFGATYHVFLVSIAVSLATLAQSRLMRTLMQMLVLGLLMLATIIGMTGGPALAEAFRSADAAKYYAFGCGVFAMLTTAVLLFESAAAGLALSTESYARGTRLAFLVQAFGGAALFLVAGLAFDSKDPVAVGSGACALYCLVVGTYVMSDRDGLAPNLRAQRSSIFSPGAYRGFVLVAVATFFIGAVFVAVGTTTHELREKDFRVMLGAPAFALLYLAAAQIVSRWVPHPPNQTAVMTRLTALALWFLGGGLPPLIGAIFTKPDDTWLNLLNPIVGLANLADVDSSFFSVAVVWVAAGLATLFATISLKRRDV